MLDEKETRVMCTIAMYVEVDEKKYAQNRLECDTIIRINYA